MNSTLANRVISVVLQTIKDDIATELIKSLDSNNGLGEERKTNAEVVNTVLNEKLAQMPAARTTRVSSRSAVNSAQLVDSSGQVLKCQSIIKTSKLPCQNKAKHTGPDGQVYCGVHFKTVKRGTPNGSERPGAPNNGKQKSSFSGISANVGSSFLSVIRENLPGMNIPTKPSHNESSSATAPASVHNSLNESVPSVNTFDENID